ncbi:IQ-domain 20 [Prunus dulcis]|uniref:IQ-domain 20 n=1 Tax=Prunus dulcis TaxID=3755 RepID=A0A4Y1RUM3_PRUDU|nr:IQ-domain 20 [Prunus dulcis]
MGSRSSNRDIIVVYTNTSPSTHEESARYQDLNGSASSSSSSTKKFLSHEDIAAIKLQAFFRGHLVCDDLNNLTGQASISSTEEPGEAASLGSWGVCAETSTYGSTLHACACPVAGQGPCTAAPQRV